MRMSGIPRSLEMLSLTQINLKYPSATHNRFEHSLGVTIIATKFAEAIRDKEKDMMSQETLCELRLAGILHDIGHGPFSHISERVYYSFPDVFQDVLQEFNENPKFSKSDSKPHEMLSYLIVTSSCFKDLFEDNMRKKYDMPNIDLDRVANIIVGDMEDLSEAYISDIINGAFDADKLDYIPRDRYFTGLKMEVDIDRIMYTISILDEKAAKEEYGGRRGLMIDISGSPFVEQVLFNKMLLYTSVYHHHKVRTLECMLCSFFEAALDNNLEINGRPFDRVTDFLSVADPDILTLEGKPEELKPFIERILNRALLKRALVISRNTVKEPKGLRKDDPVMPYQDLLSLQEDPRRIRYLRELIVQEADTELTPYDVWIDLPKNPSFKEASHTLVKITDEKRRKLHRIIPMNRWLIGYEENKWKGHVFCPPFYQYRRKVNEAALKVFRRELNLEFNNFATELAKNPEMLQNR